MKLKLGIPQHKPPVRREPTEPVRSLAIQHSIIDILMHGWTRFLENIQALTRILLFTELVRQEELAKWDI